jgi:hypothetical protein
MSVPATITAELTALQAQVTAAAPLASAAPATIAAIQLNAEQLVSDIGSALTTAAGALDTWTTPTDPNAIAAGIEALKCSAEDQATLANMAGYVGRATKNLDQLV